MTKEIAEYRILTLDGGGSKGIYTLGILYEFEKYIGEKLYQYFDLIYGTSTGSIICSLIGLGHSISKITELYFELIPSIMSSIFRKQRSEKLNIAANKLYEDLLFDSFKTKIGIVATEYDFEKPIIFKTSSKQIYSQEASFIPGFGCKISEAVMGSCAAFPFFEKVKIQTKNKGEKTLIDGGFVANNPTLFALIDATKGYDIPLDKIKVLNLGVGNYPVKSGFIAKLLSKLWPIELLQKTFNSNTNTNSELLKILYPSSNILRINDSFTKQKYATNLLESDIKKLEILYRLGIESFGKYDNKIKELFN